MIIKNSGSELKLTSTPYLGTVLWLACYFGRLSKGKDVTLHPKRKLGCESFQFPSKETPALHLIQIIVRRKCLGKYLMCINTGIAFCLKMPFSTVQQYSSDMFLELLPKINFANMQNEICGTSKGFLLYSYGQVHNFFNDTASNHTKFGSASNRP